MNAITVGKGSVVLENSAQAALQGLKLFGRSSQNGVPSPASPLWINNAGDSGTIGVTILKKQKNLCPVNDIQITTSEQIKFGVTLPAGEYEEIQAEEEPEGPGENLSLQEIEIVDYYLTLALGYSVDSTMEPTCREAHLLRKLIDPSYEVPFTSGLSRTESYLWDLIDGTQAMLSNIPKSDKEKYLHVAIGGTVDEMPNPDACLLNYWMNEWLKKLGKV